MPSLCVGLLALCGLAAIGERLAPWLLANDNATALSFYPASTVYILGILGISVLCWWTLHLALDENRGLTGSGPVLTFLRRYSGFALTAYVVHQAAYLWPLCLYAMWMGKSEPLYFEYRAMDTLTSLMLAAAFIAVSMGF